MLGIPAERVPLEAERRGEVETNGVVVEKWVFTSEPGSRVPAVLYRPQEPQDKMPAIVLTFGHGGSKSQWQYNYAGLVYAKLGLACLAMDPIGEEERHRQGRLGTRAHDPKPVSDRADRAGRLVMGKLVFDTMRGVDFLLQRDDIDPERIGVAGNSLGGAKAGWMAALEPRIRMAIVSGWAYDDVTLQTKYCTRLPNKRMRQRLTWTDYASLAAPDCAVLIANGDADWVIDKGDGSVWERTRQVVGRASSVYEKLDSAGGIRAWFEAAGGHRPYFVYKQSLEWIHRHLGTPAMTLREIRDLPTVNSGQWCDKHGVTLERLYGTPLHQRGATLPDWGLRPTPRGMLSCLHPDEVGSAPFTVEGWLEKIERQSADKPDDPNAPFSIAAVLTDEEALDRPHDVELQGDLAFVPGKGGSLAIVDVSEPTQPRLLWHRRDFEGLNDAETVLPAGDWLFLGTNQFLSLDVRDPRKPVFAAEVSTTPAISHINGMARRGDTILAAGKNGVLAAFDVSRPEEPAVAGAVDLRRQYDIGWPHDVDLYSEYAVVPDPRRFGRVNEPGKLALIQVFDSHSGELLPAEEWKLAGVVATEELVGANRVQVSGHHALVGASTRANGGRLIVVDLSEPAAPRQVATLSFAPEDGWGPNGLTVAGRVAFLAGGQSVEAIDITQPECPLKLTSQRFPKVLGNERPRYVGGGDSGHDLVYRDGYLYVTGQNDHCLLVLRVESEQVRRLAESENR